MYMSSVLPSIQVSGSVLALAVCGWRTHVQVMLARATATSTVHSAAPYGYANLVLTYRVLWCVKRAISRPFPYLLHLLAMTSTVYESVQCLHAEFRCSAASTGPR